MAEEKPPTPRFRLPRVSLPGRKKSEAETKEADAAKGTKATEEKKPAPSPKSAASTKPAGAKTAAGSTAGGPKSPEPNLQERMEGLQGWMAEIERKQGRMTYFGAAAILIAIVAAGAAIYLGLTAKNDSATNSDLDALSKKVDGLQQAVTKNTQDTQSTINSTVAQLQQALATLTKKQTQDAANIATLQAQAAAGAFNPKAGATTPGTSTTPGTTTTTPKKP